MIHAGQLRERVTFQAPSIGQNERGEDESTWATVAIRSAEVKPLNGREAERAKQISPEATWMIRTRYSASIAPEQRATFDGHTLDIQAVIDVDYRHRELLIYATEQIDE